MQIRNLEDFITQMPKDLESTMEKARWLYIELGRRSFYDVSYKYLNEDEEQELITKAKKQLRVIEKICGIFLIGIGILIILGDTSLFNELMKG